MTSIDFRAAVKELGWKYAEASERLRKSVGMIKQMAAGNAKVPEGVERLLASLLRDGVETPQASSRPLPGTSVPVKGSRPMSQVERRGEGPKSSLKGGFSSRGRK